MINIRYLERMLEPIRRRVRLMVSRGRALLVDDRKPRQVLQCSMLTEEVADGVERVQNYGHCSVPPEGSDVILVALGGQRAGMTAVAVEHPPSRPVMGKSGDSILYHAEGHRVVLTKDGTVKIRSDTLKMKSDAVSVSSKTVRVSGRESVKISSRSVSVVSTGAVNLTSKSFRAICTEGVGISSKVVDFIGAEAVGIASTAIDMTGMVSVSITAPIIELNGSVQISGTLQVNGALNVTGPISTDADLLVAGKSYLAHFHNDAEARPTTPPV